MKAMGAEPVLDLSAVVRPMKLDQHIKRLATFTYRAIGLSNMSSARIKIKIVPQDSTSALPDNGKGPLKLVAK